VPSGWGIADADRPLGRRHDERPPDRLRPALAACASGALPANVALLRLARAAESLGEVEAALQGAEEAARGRPRRFRAALAFRQSNPQVFVTVKAVLDGVEHGGEADPEGPVACSAETFDRMAVVSHEGAVALHSHSGASVGSASARTISAYVSGRATTGELEVIGAEAAPSVHQGGRGAPSSARPCSRA
jgi:hypothetical protein